ncbi:MAG: ParB/RepB/Spo0J family partition protein [Bacillota bacterium]|nr:ParB/RepB/Spo0J family partition protein [Bacillota bacterium]
MAKGGLGKGLEALLGEDAYEKAPAGSEEFTLVKLSFVEPNRGQPRKSFNEEELNALSESIKQYGVLQPITVKDEKNGFYSIIAGERRWRAAKLAGLKEIPVRVVEFSPQEELEVSLIENLQREDLNPVEEALGYKKLMDEYELTQEQVSDRVGKSRSTIANAIRLMALPGEILRLVEEKKLSGGHARAILAVKSNQKRIELAKKVVEQDLSVRTAETLAQNIEKEEKKPNKGKNAAKDADLLGLERELSESMGTKVSLQVKKKGGRIEIEYYDPEQLEGLLEYLKKYKKH